MNINEKTKFKYSHKIKNYTTEAKGITLIALVITIIILIILAGVTINLTLGENGLFNTAKEAVNSQKVAEYKDRVEISRATVAVNNLGEVTLDKLIEQIYKDKIVQQGKITKINETEAEMITEEGYKFKVTIDGVEYIDKNGDVTKPPVEEEIPVATGNVTISAPSWNPDTHKANVTITKGSSIASNLDIQYQIVTGVEELVEENWTLGTNVSDITVNQTVFARLWDGKNGGEYVSLKITEKTEPTITVAITQTSTNTITASVSSSDAESGMPANPTYTFYIKKTNEDDTEYKEIQSNAEITCTFGGLEQNTSYTIKVMASDIAGNIGTGTKDGITGTVSVAIGNLTIGAPLWDPNTHKASVTITKGSNIEGNLDVQYQVVTRIEELTEEKWTVGTNVSDIIVNQTVFARLWDGKNGGEYTSLKITEETEPTITIAITQTSINTITASVTSSDAESGMPANPTYTFYIKKTNESDTEYKEIQSNTETTCTFGGLEQNTSYTIKVTSNDLAGNTGTGIEEGITGTQKVSNITLNKTTLDIKKGETETLTTTVEPTNAYNKNVRWSSDDESIATVSGEGVVTGVGEGTTTITVAAIDGSGASARCTVNVTLPLPTVNDLKVGDYIKYDTGDNGVVLCRVLYPVSSEYGLQIITNFSLKAITIGGQTNWEDLKTNYNNAIKNLNDITEAYINTEYAFDARCVGSIPTTVNGMFVDKNKHNGEPGTAYIPENFKDNRYFGRDTGCYKSDTNYKLDEYQLVNYNLMKPGGYWLASRECEVYIQKTIVSGTTVERYDMGFMVRNVENDGSIQKKRIMMVVEDGGIRLYEWWLLWFCSPMFFFEI